MKILTSLLICLIFPSVKSMVINIEPAKDNTVYQTNLIALSNGVGPYFFAGRTSPMQDIDLQIRRGLLQFDLSGIPLGSVINHVNLRLLIASHRNDSSVALHVAESDWGEGTSNAGNPGGAGTEATPDDATWLAAFYDSTDWNNVGGDFGISTSASVAYTDNNYINLSSAQMVTDVQNWFDGSNDNYGWFVIGDESTDSTAVRFGSRENPDPSLRPQLTVNFTPPQGALNFSPNKDNTLYENPIGSVSNGAGDRMFIGKIQNGDIRRGVLEFDLSLIPTIATINSVELDLAVVNISPSAVAGSAALHLALTEWGEGSSNGSGQGSSSQTNDATWVHTFYDDNFTQLWTNPGGDFMATASATTNFSNVDSAINFNSSTELIADVTTWIQNSGDNHGWVLLGDEINDGNARSISSRESAGSPPVLTIEYTLPDLIFANGFE